MTKVEIRKWMVLIVLGLIPSVGQSSFLDKLQKTLDEAQANTEARQQSASSNLGEGKVSNESKGAMDLPSISFDPSILNAENIQLKKVGLWRDPLTKLMWTRCPVGGTWKESECDGYPKSMSWTQAMTYSQTANSGGYSGWRLPTIEEYMTLVRCGLDVTPKEAAQDFQANLGLPDGYVQRINGCFSPAGNAAQSNERDAGDRYGMGSDWYNAPHFFYKKVFNFYSINSFNFWTSSLSDDAKVAFSVRSIKAVNMNFNDSSSPSSQNPVGLLLVRDGNDSGQYAKALQVLPAESEKVSLADQKANIQREKEARETAEYERKESESRKRFVTSLDRDKAAYDQRTQTLRQHPRVNDIAQQGRILEIRGDQVRIEVYHKVCVLMLNSGCGKTEYAPNGAQAWISKSSLLAVR